MSHPRVISRSSLVAMLGAGLLFAALFPGGAVAEDTRPKEMPYDTADEIPTLDPGYRRTSHKVVLITDNDLSPNVATLEEGQLIAWISYSRSASRIVFEREVARSMKCHSLTNFSLVDDELRSADIHPGEFASFCQLFPGRYRYKVIRPDPKLHGHTTSLRRLDGEIIVGNPPSKRKSDK